MPKSEVGGPSLPSERPRLRGSEFLNLLQHQLAPVRSVAGSKGVEAFGVYNASKAAIRSFARSWTSDLKQRKIRVNVISPGPIETPILDPIPKEAIEGFVSQVPLGRIGQADEIATAALFLASDDSSYVTGIELFVDGGMAQV